MAEFCTKCFAELNEDGQCPACGHRNVPAPVVEEEPVVAPAPTPKFCMKCGGGLDENGLCPVCDAPAPAPMVDLAEMAQATDTPAADPIENPVAEETASKKKPTAWSVIATVLLSICLFVTTLASVSIIAVRTTVSESGAYNLTKKLDVAAVLQSSGVANSNNFDELYRRLERDYGVKLDDDDLADMIEESTVPRYLSEKVGDFSDDFFDGDAELVITKKEMTELIKDNLDLINDAQIEGYQGGRVQPEDCDEIADWMFNGDELVLMTTDDLSDSSPALYKVATIGLSWLALGFFLLLSALIGFVMCRNSLSQAAIGGGVVFILLGGVTALAAAVVAWIPGLWSSIVGSNLALLLAGSLLTANGLIFAILLAVGILLLVARTVVKHILKKRA